MTITPSHTPIPYGFETPDQHGNSALVPGPSPIWTQNAINNSPQSENEEQFLPILPGTGGGPQPLFPDTNPHLNKCSNIISHTADEDPPENGYNRAKNELLAQNIVAILNMAGYELTKGPNIKRRRFEK